MIGYDNSNMYLASYDWRLSFSNLEIRDKYFSKLQSMIETSHKTQGEPAVIVTHSMGSCLFPYFLRWVQSEEGGNGGEDWADKHIASFVNIAGPMVGVPKALTAMLSGETRDTISLGSFGAYLLEKFFSRRERANLLRSWAGGSSMLPKGGDAIWGNQRWAPDDEVNSRDHSYGNILSFSDTQQHEPDMSSNSSDDILISRTSEKEDHIIDQSSQHLSVYSSFELLHQTASREYGYMLNTNYSFGISTSKKQLEKNNKDPRKWSSPLESQLPIGNVYAHEKKKTEKCAIDTKETVLKWCIFCKHLDNLIKYSINHFYSFSSTKYENLLYVWRWITDRTKLLLYQVKIQTFISR
jgi:phospholipid:diacylglycerol acyltransferase